MAEFSRSQVSLMRRARKRANQLGATRIEKQALAAAGIVETNVEHMTGGDRDSTGFLQQRPSAGWGPVGESVEKDTEQFLAHARQYRGKIKDPGDLAAAVQRPAAQYASRYGERMGEAKQLLAEARAGPSGTATPGPRGIGKLDRGRAPSLTPGSTTLDAKGAMLDALLDERKSMSLVDRFQERVATGAYTTVTPAKLDSGKMPKYTAPTDDSPGARAATARAGRTSTGVPIQRIQRQAEKIDRAQVDYLWGGGHQHKIGRKEKVTPMDCSGSVSRLLGINPMVSGQFAKWGKAGRDPDGGFTVYANDTHVLVEIGGHFWGTSGANKGGGAGWIPRAKVSKDYLSRFTARH